MRKLKWGCSHSYQNEQRGCQLRGAADGVGFCETVGHVRTCGSCFKRRSQTWRASDSKPGLSAGMSRQ